MPTLNVRLATIIFVVFLVLGGGVHLLHGFQVGRQAHALKDASERAEAEKNLDEATRHLYDYVTLVPKDRRAELHLGVLYADARNARAAFAFLEEGLRQSDKDPSVTPDDVREARRKLVDVAIMLGRPSDAQTHLDILLEGTVEKNQERKKQGLKPEGDPELLDLYGQILRMNGKDKEASEVFRDAIAIAPNQVNSYVHLAIVLSSTLDQKAEADAVIEDMVAKNDKSVAAYEKYCYYFYEQGKYDTALAKAQEMLKLAPDEPHGLLLVGRCYVMQRKYAEAEEVLRKGVKAAKDDYAMYIVLADAQNHLRKGDEAIATLKQGLEATKGTKGSMQILWYLAEDQIIARDFAEAGKHIKELREGGYPPSEADFLDAWIAIQQQDWNVAKRLLLDVIAKVHDNPSVRCQAFLHLGQCYHQEGLVNEQILAYRQALKIDPFNFVARASLAEIYLGQHKLKEADEEYRIAEKGPQRKEAMLNRVQVLIMLCLQTDKEKRDWQPVDALLDQLAPKNEKTGKTSIPPQIAVLRAEVLLAKDQSKDLSKQAKLADELLRKCTDAVPKSAEAWLARIKLAMHRADKQDNAAEKEKRWKETAALIDEAEKSLGDRVLVRFARGCLAVRSNDPHAVDVLTKLGENLDPLSDAEKTQLRGFLSTLCVEVNALDLARGYCRQIVEKEPKNARARYLLCDLHLRAYEKGLPADMQELDRLVDEIEQLGGRGPFWLYAKAIRTLVRSKSKDPQLLLEARGYLQDAMEERKDWSSPVVLAGKICELQDEPDQALELYTRAIYFMNERDNDVIRRTVQLLVPRRRIEEAKNLFDYLEKQKSPLLDEMQKEYVFVKVFTGDIAAAEMEVDKSVAADSTNFKDITWQGEMYATLALRLKAEAQQRDREAVRPGEGWKADPAMLKMAQRGVNSLLRARLLNPQAEGVWIALVRLLLDVGQGDKAMPLIAEMEHTLKGDSAQVTLGICCELLGKSPEAQQHYEAAVKATPENCRNLRQLASYYLRTGQIASAEPQLRKIISLETPGTLTDVCWARRSLALILQSRGDFDDLCKAQELIEENLQSKAATAEDRRTKVQFLIADPRKTKINDAIAAMEDLVKRPDAALEDNFTLAQLYLKKGDKVAYEERMRSVLGASRVQTRHIVFYINTLLDRKEFEDADRWLLKLEKAAPNNFDTVRTRAEYLFRLNDYAAARDKVVTYVDNLDPKSPDRPQQLYLVAGLMEEFAGRLRGDNKQVAAADFDAKADLLFSSLRSKRVTSNGDLFYSAYLARQKRIRESLEVLKDCWESSDPNLLSLPVAAIVNSHAATAAQYEQLENIFLAAVAKFHRPTNLLLMLSVVHEEQRQYDKAKEDYREVLAKEPRNYQALNNLAVNLARNGGDLDEALSLINQALAVKGPLATVFDSRALVYIARNDPAKALEDATLAVQDSGAPEQYFHQAWAYSLLDRKSEAAAAFDAALKKGLDRKLLDPREIPMYDRLKDSL